MPLLALRPALLVLLAVWALALSLHLLRPRRRRVLVPFMPLWDALLLPEASTRLFGRLRRLGSLLIALLISALLVAALIDPKAGALRSAAGSTIVLIDAGQHMQATDVEPSRLAQARRLALQLLAAGPNGAHDELLIAQLDANVTPLSTLSSDRSALRSALERLTPSDAASDFAAGAAFALQLLEGRARAKLVLISDGAFEVPAGTLERLRARGVEFQHLTVGRAVRNLGIRSFSARRYLWNRSQSELLLELENAGDAAEPVELTLSGDGAPLAVTQLELPAHSVVSRVYGELPAQAERLEARIVARGPLGPDALASDDRAYAVLPAASTTRVLLVSNGDRYLEAALLLDRTRHVDVVAPSAYRNALGHDLVIFDGCAPETPPDAPSLYLAPPKNARDFPFRVKGSVARPVFDTFAREHPLLHQIALRDVNIAQALRLELHTDDRVVAAAQATPLIVTGQRAGQPFVALSFDIRDSDLPLRVAWPLLVSHAVDYLREPAPGYRPALQVGLEQRIPLNHAARSARISSPQAAAQNVAVRRAAVWFRPMTAGFYRVETPAEQQLWAANRAAQTSLSIKPQRLAASPGRAVPSTAPFPVTDLWQLWVGLAWSIVLLEWFAFQRRWTV
jgi:hypothetical protein